MKETGEQKIERMKILNNELLSLEKQKHEISMKIKKLEQQILDSW